MKIKINLPSLSGKARAQLGRKNQGTKFPEIFRHTLQSRINAGQNLVRASVKLRTVAEQVQDPIATSSANFFTINHRLTVQKVDLGLLEQSGLTDHEHFKQLLKKIALNFRSTHDRVGICIKAGIFRGAYIDITKVKDTINLDIRNSQKRAKNLLNANAMTLKKRLANHQIKLGFIKFSA